jgi:hypothetical protein
MKEYCWQFHLKAELLCPAVSMFSARSAHCVTIITGSINMALPDRFQCETAASIISFVIVFIVIIILCHLYLFFLQCYILLE